MSEPEQCIICLEPLPRPSSALLGDVVAEAASSDGTGAAAEEAAVAAATGTSHLDSEVAITAADVVNDADNELNNVAALDGCEHIIHDVCIRSWAQKTNTCPICRNLFHKIRVYNGVDGTGISEYTVEDKKQVAEFDVQQWLGENPDEEEPAGHPCPICNEADREDILLLCDGCDAAYHTVCIGLEEVPDGDWYCMECQHSGLFGPSQTEQAEQAEPPVQAPRSTRPQVTRGRPRNRRNLQGERLRTRARLRRAQRQARHAAWHGPWGQFSGRFFEMSDVDLDNHDDEDDELGQYRQFQLHDRQELDRWQQRMDIAHRLGALSSFANSIPRQISQRLQTQPATPPPPPPVVETPDERRAWGVFDRVRESQIPAATNGTNGRKRKTRSVTASPAEPVPEPERKLKRPRTKRLATQGESSAAGAASASGVSGAAAATASSPVTAHSPTWRAPEAAHNSRPNGRPEEETPLVSSLLKELEPGAPTETEDEGVAAVVDRRHPPEASSPALSPVPSAHSSPRALSLTPPPLSFADSPTIPLSTHIQPRYRPANYLPTRTNHDHSPTRTHHDLSPTRTAQEQSDAEFKAARTEAWSAELRQPRPRRPHQVPRPREEGSPSRGAMTPEEKKNINDIVKSALRPHWHAKKLNADQYALINRDISRMLYDEVKDASSLDDDSKRSWERRASQEVARALAELEA